MSMTNGGSPWIQSALAATKAPSMQCARRCRSTSRTERIVSPSGSWLIGIALRKSWIFCGVSSGRRIANSCGVSPRSFRRANRRCLAAAMARYHTPDNRRRTIMTVPGMTTWAGGRRPQLLALGLACAAFLFAAPALAQLEIKLGHVGEPGSLFQKSADEFARRVNEKLAGKAKVIAYGSSQLGSDEGMIQKLKLGTIDMALPSTVMSS